MLEKLGLVEGQDEGYQLCGSRRVGVRVRWVGSDNGGGGGGLHSGC